MSDIQESATTPQPEENPHIAGVPHGTVLEAFSPSDNGNVKEVVIEDKDEDGNVIGWHKEVVNG